MPGYGDCVGATGGGVAGEPAEEGRGEELSTLCDDLSGAAILVLGIVSTKFLRFGACTGDLTRSSSDVTMRLCGRTGVESRAQLKRCRTYVEHGGVAVMGAVGRCVPFAHRSVGRHRGRVL